MYTGQLNQLQRKQHFASVVEHLKYALSLSNPQQKESALLLEALVAIG